LAVRALSRAHTCPGVRALALPLYIFVLTCAIFFVGQRVAQANATVTPASGGTITVETAAPLSGPTVAEVAPGDVGPGNITLQAPAGFAFDPGTPVTAMVSNKGSCGQSTPPLNKAARSGPKADKQTKAAQQQKEPQQQKDAQQQKAGQPMLLSGGPSQTVRPTPDQITVTVAQSSSGDCRATISWSSMVVVAKQLGSSGVITKAPGGSRILGVADGATGFSQQLTATAPAPPPAPVPQPPVEPPPVEPVPAEPVPAESVPVETAPVEPGPVEPAPIVSVPAVLGQLCNAVGFGLFSNSFGLFSDSLCQVPVAAKAPSQKEVAPEPLEKSPSQPKPKPEEQKKKAPSEPQEKTPSNEPEPKQEDKKKPTPEPQEKAPSDKPEPTQEKAATGQEKVTSGTSENRPPSEPETKQEKVAPKTSEKTPPSAPEQKQKKIKKGDFHKEATPKKKKSRPKEKISVKPRSEKSPPTLKVTIDANEEVSFGSGLSSGGARSSDDTMSAYRDGEAGAYYVKNGALSRYPAVITVDSSGPWSGSVSATDTGTAGMTVRDGSFRWRLGDMGSLDDAKSGKPFTTGVDNTVFDIASSCSRGRPKQPGPCTYNFDYSLLVRPGDAQGTFSSVVKYSILPL
jgi:hypothetical protein